LLRETWNFADSGDGQQNTLASPCIGLVPLFARTLALYRSHWERASFTYLIYQVFCD